MNNTILDIFLIIIVATVYYLFINNINAILFVDLPYHDKNIYTILCLIIFASITMLLYYKLDNKILKYSFLLSAIALVLTAFASSLNLMSNELKLVFTFIILIILIYLITKYNKSITHKSKTHKKCKKH